MSVRPPNDAEAAGMPRAEELPDDAAAAALARAAGLEGALASFRADLDAAARQAEALRRALRMELDPEDAPWQPPARA